MTTTPTPAGSPPLTAQIESVATMMPAGVQEDFRVLAQTIVSNLVRLSPGNTLLAPGGVQKGSGSTPSGVGIGVNGANGAYTVKITNPATNGATIWHEVSYSTVKSFASNVTVLPVTSATSVNVNAPGTTYFFRIRSSFDQTNWSGYSLASTTATSSGLVSSAATSDATALNQTNYGVVASTAVGSTAEVSISGPSAPLTSLVKVKGPTQVSLPGATILGVAPGSDQFVVHNGSSYALRPTLAGALGNDTYTPIGKVSVVDTGTPVLPTIVPIIQGGGIVAYNVTNQGNGISGPLTLTITDPGGTGTGATTGEQTIENGKLIAVAPGNPGQNYDSATTVTPSGGVNPGTPGGGTAAGGNGGRMTAV